MHLSFPPELYNLFLQEANRLQIPVKTLIMRILKQQSALFPNE
jgi:hypothetical protein